MSSPVQPPNRELVVYVLALTGGESKRIHTESIAIECHKLFPHSFSWTKYPNLPDKDIVRVALTDARKERNGALVEGRAGQSRGHSAVTKRAPIADGWILTPDGVAWVRENRERLDALADSGALKGHRQLQLRQLQRLRRHRLFVSYSEAPERFTASLGELADLLRCRVDADESVWTKRFESLRGKAEATEQDDLSDFLDKCHTAYTHQP